MALEYTPYCQRCGVKNGHWYWCELQPGERVSYTKPFDPNEERAYPIRQAPPRLTLWQKVRRWLQP